MFTLYKDLPALGCHTSIEVRTEVQKAARLAEGWSLEPPPVPLPAVEAPIADAPVAPTVEVVEEDAPRRRGRPRKADAA